MIDVIGVMMLLKRSIIHVDIDAFYASIEQKDNPCYRNKPIAVGGDPEKRGVVCTASYEARKYGVKSAMSCKMAQKLCPNLIFVPVRMERYLEISKHIHQIFETYSDLIEPISIDEAFIDVSGQDPVATALNIKKKILNDLGLTASVGISINKYLSKLASDYNKPNGFKIITESEVRDFLMPLTIRKLWGVGPKTEKDFHKLGIYKICDLLNYDRGIIVEKFGKRGLELLDFAEGKDVRPVENKYRRKSIGEEMTFEIDVDDTKVIRERIQSYCKDLVNHIQSRRLLVKTIIIKIKYEDFSCITRSITLPYYTDSLEIIAKTADNILYNKIAIDKKIRLIGVQISNIVYPDEPVQIQMEL